MVVAPVIGRIQLKYLLSILQFGFVLLNTAKPRREMLGQNHISRLVRLGRAAISLIPASVRAVREILSFCRFLSLEMDFKFRTFVQSSHNFSSFCKSPISVISRSVILQSLIDNSSNSCIWLRYFPALSLRGQSSMCSFLSEFSLVRKRRSSSFKFLM